MIDKYKARILKIIFEKLDKDNCIVFLFGSYADHTAVKSSDIDIGIMSTDKILSRDFLDVQERINSEIPILREIDLVDFSAMNDTVKREASKKVNIWHIGKNCQELLKNFQQH